MFNLMTNESNFEKLIGLLDRAEHLAGEFSGGYSGSFFSAEDFHAALFDSITKLKQGDESQLAKLHILFLPTSCWDDFIGRDGEILVNEICNLLSKIVK